MTDNTENLSTFIDDLLAKAEEEEVAKAGNVYDVDVLLASEVVTVRLPHLGRAVFDDLTDKHSPGFGFRDSRGCWFDLNAVAAGYPDVVLVSGDQTDDLYALRGKEAVYRWPEVYAALSAADRESVQAVIWGVYVWEPQQRLTAAKEKRVSNV